MLYHVFATFDILIKIKTINLTIVVSIIPCMPDWWLVFGVTYSFCNNILSLTKDEKVSIGSSLIYKISTKTKFAILLMFIYHSDNLKKKKLYMYKDRSGDVTFVVKILISNHYFFDWRL